MKESGDQMKRSKPLALLLCLLLMLSVFSACGKTKTEGTTSAGTSTSAAEAEKETAEAATSTKGEGDKATENKDAKDTKGESAAATENKATETQPSEEGKKETTDMEHTKVKFTMENGGTFTMELYPEYAPKTVENFIKLVKSGYYSGTTFHRIYPGFMAQGGEGADTPSIKGEFASNGFSQNTLSHTRGVVSMARTTVKDSASSQFFICYDDATFLDGDYAAFAKVIDGMDTVDAFCEIERVFNGIDRVPTSPVEDIVIQSAEIV